MKNLTEDNITGAVLGTISATENERLKEVSTSLIRHLHAFAKEIELKPEEWLTAIDFLFRAGKISTPERNEFILISDVLGLSSLVDIIKSKAATGGTEYSVLGPFFVEDAPELPIGGDMIKDNEGEPVVVSGRILDDDGNPVSGALVDVWQTQDNALYDVQDPECEGLNMRCQMRTGEDGVYKVTTVRPRPYKVPDDGPVGEFLRGTSRHAWRPAHFHFWIKADGFRPLVTELFPKDDPYIDTDAVFGVRDSLSLEMKRIDSEEEATKLGLSNPFTRVDYDFYLNQV